MKEKKIGCMYSEQRRAPVLSLLPMTATLWMSSRTDCLLLYPFVQFITSLPSLSQQAFTPPSSEDIQSSYNALDVVGQHIVQNYFVSSLSFSNLQELRFGCSDRHRLMLVWRVLETFTGISSGWERIMFLKLGQLYQRLLMKCYVLSNQACNLQCPKKRVHAATHLTWLRPWLHVSGSKLSQRECHSYVSVIVCWVEQ